MEWEVGGGGGDRVMATVAGEVGVCVTVGGRESVVGAGISTLSHRVSVQPSTTAEHTTPDSSLSISIPPSLSTHTRLNSQGHTLYNTHSHADTCCKLPRGPQGRPKQVSADGV